LGVASIMNEKQLNRITVLIIGIDDERRWSLQKMLKQFARRTFEVAEVSQLSDNYTRSGPRYDVLLLDTISQESKEKQLLSSVKRYYTNTPIIVIGEKYEQKHVDQLFDWGVQDYLVFSEIEMRFLAKTISSTIAQYQLKFQLTLTQKYSHKLATQDVQTGLSNSTAFIENLNCALMTAKESTIKLAVFYITLNGFRKIHQNRSDEISEQILHEISERFLDIFKDIKFVAHIALDEFACFIESPDDNQTPANYALKISETIEWPVRIGDECFGISASMGIALFPNNASDAEQLLKYAELAEREMREDTQNHFKFYDNRMSIIAERRLLLERDLRNAEGKAELLLYYQPQFDFKNEEIVGVEALIRWLHPERGMVPPDDFINLAEATGLILPIGEWVIRTACQQHVDWLRMGLPPIRIAVNLSTRQFEDQDLPLIIGRILNETGMSPEYLELEVTESAMMKNSTMVLTRLNSLKDMGLRFAIDDFGTGYSSLSYLWRFPIDLLKIDGSFMRVLQLNPKVSVIISTIIGMAKVLSMEVVAEGVESINQINFLKEQDCFWVQGYLLSRPVTGAELVNVFHSQKTIVSNAIK